MKHLLFFQKKRKKTIRFLVMVQGIACCMGFMLRAFDLPVFYRAPFFQGRNEQKPTDWMTSVSVRYGQGSTRTSRDGQGNKRPLLSAYDSINLLKLGVGLESPSPRTDLYWKKANPSAGLLGSVNTANPLDGQIDINGRIRAYEFDINLEQSLFAGFFAGIYLPIRQVKIDSVSYQNRGAENLNGVDIKAFLKDNDKFPAILKENGFTSSDPLDSFSKTGLSDMVVFAGWHGYDDTCFNILNSIGATVQAGIIIPTEGRKNENRLFSIPLCYNGLWGIQGRANAEIGVWRFFKVGLGAGASIFFRETRKVRMKTDLAQNGWVVLETGRAEIDPGVLWDLSGYLKAYRITAGLSFGVGYAFVEQERTKLSVNDDTFLKTVVTNALNNPDPSDFFLRGARFISKDAYVNTDQRYHKWNQHILNFFAEYDTKAHTTSQFAPTVAFEYSYPVDGMRVFMTDMFAGSLSFNVVWNF